MARKKPDLKAAKAAKQKKIVIVGSVLLVALLAFQAPRTMKMLHHKAPTPSHHKSTLASGQATTAAGTTYAPSPSTAPMTTSPLSSASSATVLTAELAPPAREGQLSVLSASFKSKDPFRQLVDADSSSSSSTGASTATTTPPPTTQGEPSLKVVPSTTPTPTTAPAGTAPAAPAAPTVRKITLPFLSAVIAVNGARQRVDVKVDFPDDTPLFHLVSLTKKTAKISVSGGSLASGKHMLTLRRGKPLTLVNTADGTRFRLVLVSTSTSAAVKPATAQAPVGETATTAPTQTTPTVTPQTPTIGG